MRYAIRLFKAATLLPFAGAASIAASDETLGQVSCAFVRWRVAVLFPAVADVIATAGGLP
jgi:hypothetical protein